MQEKTLSIIKPDALRKNKIGAIISKFEESGIRVAAMKMAKLSEDEARIFYGVHRERPFFNDLIKYICSGPVVLMVLSGEDVVRRNREIMGSTNPADAAPGTIRREFATSIEENAVHGSDSTENAAIEVAYFFSGTDIF